MLKPLSSYSPFFSRVWWIIGLFSCSFEIHSPQSSHISFWNINQISPCRPSPSHTHTHTLFTYLYLKTLSWLSTGFKMKKLSIHLTPACISKFVIFSRLQLHRSLFEYPKCLRTVCVSFYSFFTLLPELYLVCCLAGGGGFFFSFISKLKHHLSFSIELSLIM